LIAKNFLISSYNVCFKLLDKGFVEMVGPKGFTSLFYSISVDLRKQQTGYIYQYACIMVFISLIIYLYLIC
jgi:hypothetical protein